MSLNADVVVRRRHFQLDASLMGPTGSVVCVLGPNGAGKTTLLRALAGLQPLTDGRVALDGQVLDDVAAGVRVPPQRRPIGVVFQDYRLFRHLSALENVAFGLRARGWSRRAARRRAEQELASVGVGGTQAAARPAALSGGQAQRVALARALVVQPRLLLLDEPLAALDAQTRSWVRADLARRLRSYDGVTILITHDPLDALVLADTLVILEEGSVVQAGSPAAVARHPRSDYVARLVGLNLYRGHAEGERVVLDDGGGLTVTGQPSGDVLLAVRPAAVSLHGHRPEGSPRNVWPGTVAEVELRGDVVRVQVDGTPSAAVDVTPAAVAELGLAPGRPVWLAVKATEVTVYPA